eukprot:TRINITY_DN2239_c0_g1_i1.p1 TRINITY_DN2239_c0_g1~~TRINITY_DN2239_c0_g1_i1.p1  ORF type:complete len:947 (-),score=236.04 TRINITY_DN2239_c0_g1_i1:131-2971(-)
MEKPCTLLIHHEKGEPPNVGQLKESLESGADQDKVSALKKTILLLLSGENLPGILMTVIRFVMPTKDHTLKKLVLLFWEVAEKTGPDGKLLHEMILVCNFLRMDLNHPNEYIRGMTLRFLCKMKEVEILEPLVPSIRTNLEHRHAYVRRNAALAMLCVFKNFEHLLPDAPQIIFNFLAAEADTSCKRNAFLMLVTCSQEKAVEYLSGVLDQVASFADIIQLLVVDLIRKVSKTQSSERSKYFRCIFTLLGSSSPSVQFQSAGTLVSLLSAPTAVRAATSTYISLLCNQSDNNVKMIVLDRLLEIKQKHPKVLQELLMDVLRALASPNMDIRRKTLDIALDLVNPKNIDEVISVLKKEINKTQSKEIEKGGEYRQMLIQAIHTCAVKFPDVASSVVDVLMDFLGDTNVASAVDVITFVREVVETYDNLRESILKKLLICLGQIRASKVFRSSLWIIGEYSNSEENIDAAITKIKELLGEPPFIDLSPIQGEAEKQEKTTKAAVLTPNSGAGGGSRLLLPDGTYASQSAFSENTDQSPITTTNGQSLRALLLSGDFFLGSSIASTLTKLVLKLQQRNVDQKVKNSVSTEVLYLLVSMLSLGKSGLLPNPIDTDSYERIVLCVKVLTKPKGVTAEVFTKLCKKSFAHMLRENQKTKEIKVEKPKEVDVQADDLIKIRQLRGKRAVAQSDLEDEVDNELSSATGIEKEADLSTKLSRIIQLTGFSDPIYAEAFVNVHQYDIVLDVTVINQTNDTLQNVSLELATLGDLKLCERPQNYTIGPRDKRQIKANIKVSSTETGIIFGNIVYDVAGSSSSDKNCVILNDIHIDIMDYIAPAHCSEAAFRTMWQEFEWENKVAVNTTILDVNQFLKHILQCTNMASLTPKSALEGDCGFLSANLYAKSIFGEDALANISIEKQADGKIAGFIRIRSKTQGIALSLGDKITLKQKGS